MSEGLNVGLNGDGKRTLVSGHRSNEPLYVLHSLLASRAAFQMMLDDGGITSRTERTLSACEMANRMEQMSRKQLDWPRNVARDMRSRRDTDNQSTKEYAETKFARKWARLRIIGKRGNQIRWGDALMLRVEHGSTPRLGVLRSTKQPDVRVYSILDSALNSLSTQTV